MSKIVEIRWHGRGGQGTKTVAEFLALVAIREGKYSQGFPEYGPERSGAPIKGYTRVSDAQIKMHSAIYHPDVVIVLDATLLESGDVCEGLKEEGTVIVNSSLLPAALKRSYPFLKGKKVWTIDATAISREEIGRPIPNMPMLGALVKAIGVLKLESIGKNIGKEFSRKFSKKVLEGNIRSVQRAFEEAKSS